MNSKDGSCTETHTHTHPSKKKKIAYCDFFQFYLRKKNYYILKSSHVNLKD